jgi:hypothetical protein
MSLEILTVSLKRTLETPVMPALQSGVVLCTDLMIFFLPKQNLSIPLQGMGGIKYFLNYNLKKRFITLDLINCFIMITSKYFLVFIAVFIGVASKAQYNFPLKQSDDKRYLVDQNNRPFPILGRAAWFIISLPDTSMHHFIDNTVAHGHNAIEMSVITHWQMGNHAPFDANHNIPFLKTVTGDNWNGDLIYKDFRTESPDLLTPNEAYWKHIDSLFAFCDAKGILVLMFPCYVGYSSDKEDQGWMKELVANGPAKDSAYGAWFASRYKDQKNILWLLMGDKGKFTEEQAAAEAALIKGLKSVPAQRSTQYTAESQSGENAADNTQFGYAMTMNGSYSWERHVPIPYITRKAYAHKPVMPAFLLEEPYDEEGPDGNNYNPNAIQPVRKFQWWGWLNTIGGYMSGNGYVWQFVDGTWQQHLNTQAALDMMRMNVFIKSISWWQLVPGGLNDMPDLVVNNTADTTDAFVAADATRDGSLFVAYIPPAHTGDIVVNMKPLKQNLYSYWFDPTSAQYYPVEKILITKDAVCTFHPPHANSQGQNDWVLLLTTKKR